MDMSLLDLLKMAMETKTGSAVAVLALSVLMWVLTRVPVVGDWLNSKPVVKKIATAVLAVIPAVILSIQSHTVWYEALMTAVVTGFAALGVSGLLPEKTA